MGIIIGLIVIGLVEESLKFAFLPPLITNLFNAGFIILEYRLAYYQVIVLFNAMILGLNLGPGLLSIVEVERKDSSALQPSYGSESTEIPLTKATWVHPTPEEESGLNLLTEVYTQFEQGAIDAEEYKRVRKQVVHEWHLARQATISMN